MDDLRENNFPPDPEAKDPYWEDDPAQPIINPRDPKNSDKQSPEIKDEAPMAAKKKSAKKTTAKTPETSVKRGRGRAVDANKKAAVMEWLSAHPERGAKKEAAKKFGISYPTINNWANAEKVGSIPKAPKAAKTGTAITGELITVNGKKYIAYDAVKNMTQGLPKGFEKELGKLAASLAKLAEGAGINLRQLF